MSSSDPRFFPDAAAWRTWLARHAATTPELIVGFWKVDCGRPSMTWPESVDEALCVGWIDGVRQRLDDEAYRIRFTPRRPGSEAESFSIVPDRRLQTPPIEAHSTAIARAMASMCNDERGRFQVQGGHE